MLVYPEEAIEGSVLHELRDDPLWGRSGHDTLQLQHIGMIELSQDPRFTEEHPPLPVRGPPAQSLHRHQHLPPARRAVTTAGDLAELSFSREGEKTVSTGLRFQTRPMRLKSFSSTCTDHLLNLQVGGIDLTGEFFNRLTGVFVRRRVHVILHSS